VANSASAPVYFGILKTYVGGLSVLHWINDALMAVFFLRYLGTYRRHRRLDGDGRRSQDRNLPLLLFVLFENFQTFNSPSEHHSVIRQRFFANPFLALSVIGAQALHITAMHLPLLAATEGGARCLGPRAFLSGSNVGRRPFRRSPPD
jgi:hypothetical protein